MYKLATKFLSKRVAVNKKKKKNNLCYLSGIDRIKELVLYEDERIFVKRYKAPFKYALNCLGPLHTA